MTPPSLLISVLIVMALTVSHGQQEIPWGNFPFQTALTLATAPLGYQFNLLLNNNNNSININIPDYFFPNLTNNPPVNNRILCVER